MTVDGVRATRAVLVVWAMFAVVTAAVVVTYTRLPPNDLYNVSGRGFVDGGLSRAVVYVNFPVGLAAVAMIAAVADRMSRSRRSAAALAVALWTPVFSRDVLSQAHLDARPLNAIPAAGVALAAALTLTTPALRPARVRGDSVRIALAVLLVLLALPWLAAELGFSFKGVPVLGQIFQTAELRHEPGKSGVHPAVHHGDHHGLEGTLLVLTALLLSRMLGAMRSARLHATFGLLVALLIAYGLGNVANDAWLEQVVKRGWTSTKLPDVLQPSVSFGWLGIVAGALALWLALFRPRYPRRTAPDSARSAMSSSP